MDFDEEALAYHRGSKRAGKIGTEILTRVEGKRDLSLAYSPGVAVPCLEIAKSPEKIYEYTGKGNSVAVISNGSAVLGLGNIGSAASKPVMEGKALLFKYFAGIDAIDVEIDSKDVGEIVRTIELISGTYGGINLEDFKAPECFEIESRLKESLGIPVFHDDQHGTAVVVGAGLLNALKIAGKKIEDVKVVINGAGAAGIAIGKMLKNLGVGKSNLVVCDSCCVISKNRNGINGYKKEFAVDEDGSLEDVLKGADVFVGVSKRDLVSPEMLLSMNSNPILFALANPDPEIDRDLAIKTREDVIMATGRSDFPNQVNNVLVFPGVFRGALDSRAKKINEEMKVAAVEALVGLVENPTRDRFIVGPFERGVVVEVAFGVARAAVKSGVAGDGFDLGGYKGKLEEEFLKNGNFERKV
jgi:malate dehydrogenase (oxaloacetate-decarboxylating)(NADP+)